MTDPAVRTEQFVAVVREDQLSHDDLNDETFLRELMFHVWRDSVEGKGGVTVSDENDITITHLEIDDVKIIRITGWARRQ